MEKLGVVLDKNKTDLVQKNRTCPKCSRQFDSDAATPKCDVCGTEPFESRIK